MNSQIISSPNLSSHVLDTSLGIPGEGIKVVLEKLLDETFFQISQTVTDKDGRIKRWKDENQNYIPIYTSGKENQIYRLRFLIKEYFSNQNKKCFFTYIEIVFEMNENEHYHVPILLSPYGYTTYRGS